MSHLRNVMAHIMQVRQEKGYTTNQRALRLWIEHARYPFRSVDGQQMVLSEAWFVETPVKYAGENPSCWISPSGMVWGIGYAHHYSFAKAAIGEDQQELEKFGWLHVSANTAYQYMPMPERQRRAWDEFCAREQGKGRYVRLRDMMEEMKRCDWRAHPAEHVPENLKALGRGALHSYSWEHDERLATAYREDGRDQEFLYRIGGPRPQPVVPDPSEFRASVWDELAHEIGWKAGQEA